MFDQNGKFLKYLIEPLLYLISLCRVHLGGINSAKRGSYLIALFSITPRFRGIDST